MQGKSYRKKPCDVKAKQLLERNSLHFLKSSARYGSFAYCLIKTSCVARAPEQVVIYVLINNKKKRLCFKLLFFFLFLMKVNNKKYVFEYLFIIDLGKFKIFLFYIWINL